MFWFSPLDVWVKVSDLTGLINYPVVRRIRTTIMLSHTASHTATCNDKVTHPLSKPLKELVCCDRGAWRNVLRTAIDHQLRRRRVVSAPAMCPKLDV